MWTQRQMCRWKTMWRRHTRRRQPCDWSDVPTSQEKPKTAGNIRGGKEGFSPSSCRREHSPVDKLISDFWPPELEENEFLLFSTTQLLVLCLGSQEESAGRQYLWGETLRLILRVWKQLEAGTTTCSCGAGMPFLAWGWQRQRANPNHVLSPPAFQSPFSLLLGQCPRNRGPAVREKRGVLNPSIPELTLVGGWGAERQELNNQHGARKLGWKTQSRLYFHCPLSEIQHFLPLWIQTKNKWLKPQ